MIPRSLLVVAVVGAVVASLSGCGVPSAPAPSSPASGVASPTPTAQAQGDPLPTLPLTCGDFFSEQAASDLLFLPVTLKVSETSVRSTYTAAALQAGATRCIWGADDKTDNGWDQTIVLDALPDGAEAFDTNVWQVDDGAIVYPDGSTTSEYLCSWVEPTYAGCFANVLVDGYWAHAYVQTGGSDRSLTREAVEANLRAIVDSVTAAISSAGPPRPDWIVPSGVLAGGICAGQGLGDDSTVGSIAAGRAGMLQCTVGPNSVTVLPGGAWALAPILANGQPTYSVRSLEQIEVAGADAAAWGCGDGCYAFFSIGGSLVSVYSGDIYDGEAFTPTLEAFVAEVVAAG
ncbi:MAG: hypothetical protein LCH43_07945 [Actinobacteria bacterium]|nr:hypothetical protein [Actinomycetota bacterium]